MLSLLTRLALRGRLITIVAMLSVVVGGAYTLTQLRVELFPDIDFPLVTVVTFYPQADPKTVLRDVSEPVEKAVTGLGDSETVRSISSANFSLVMAEFDFGTDMEAMEAAVSENLSRVTFPGGVQAPRVARVNPDEFPVLVLSVLSSREIAELYSIVTTQILPGLREVPGVFSAEVPQGSDIGLSITRTNGSPSLPISVVKLPNANTVEVVDAVMESLDASRAKLPSDIEFITIANQAPEIQSSIDTLTREVFLGGILAVVVIFAFLLSVRPTLVTSISIPVSILGGLIIMGWQGMSLNIVTLGALAVAVGRVVDDSIVVMENIYRHIQRGDDRVQAALTATKEVAPAITTSTLTTIAVFAPLGLVGGLIGAFFFPFALTVTFALLASLLAALTIVPVIGSLLIRKGTDTGSRDTLLQRAYAPILRWALAHKIYTILGAVALFFAGLGLLAFIPQSFLSTSGQNLLTIEMTVEQDKASGAVLEELDQVEGVLARLRSDGTVDAYQSTLGSSGLFFGPGGGLGNGPNTVDILVLLEEDADAEETAGLLRRDLSNPGRSIVVSQAQGGGGESNQLELILHGEDRTALAVTAERIAERLQSLDGLINVKTDNLMSDGQGGTEDITPITRINGEMAVTITGTITEQNTQAMNRVVSRLVDEVGLPQGVELDTGGVFADTEEAFSQMARAMIIGVVLVYLVMMVSQRSLVTPFVIIISLPLASIGALGALFITQHSLGLSALLGILMLIGLVVTNAVVLIAFVEQLRARGMSIYDALVEGGRVRLRPILMTAFTTSFALLPLAVIVTESSGIIGAELATVVIGGLMTSTFLTLVVIPVAYSLLRRQKAQTP